MVRRLAGTRAGHVDSLRHSPEPLAPPARVLVGDPTSPLSIIACSVHRATTSSTSRQAPPPMSVSRMSLTGAPLKRVTTDLFWLVPPGSVGSILRWPPGRLGRPASASLASLVDARPIGEEPGLMRLATGIRKSTEQRSFSHTIHRSHPLTRRSRRVGVRIALRRRGVRCSHVARAEALAGQHPQTRADARVEGCLSPFTSCTSSLSTALPTAVAATALAADQATACTTRCSARGRRREHCR